MPERSEVWEGHIPLPDGYKRFVKRIGSGPEILVCLNGGPGADHRFYEPLRRLVDDVLKWFHAEEEGHVEKAGELRARFEAGELYVLAPPLLWLEILNVAARGWHWSGRQLDQLAATLPLLGIETVQPGLDRVAAWAASGLTAYVTVADEAGIHLVTDDAGILRAAPELAIPLAG